MVGVLKVSTLRRALADLDADAAVLLSHDESFLDLKVRNYSNPSNVIETDHIVLVLDRPQDL